MIRYLEAPEINPIMIRIRHTCPTLRARNRVSEQKRRLETLPRGVNTSRLATAARWDGGGVFLHADDRCGERVWPPGLYLLHL